MTCLSRNVFPIFKIVFSILNQPLFFILREIHILLKKHVFHNVPASLFITASGNILTNGNISLELFMAPLETIARITFWQVQHHFAQLQKVSDFQFRINPAGNYMFKVNNRNTRTRCEICSKLTIKIPQRRHWRRSRIFIVNFEHISHLALVILLLTLRR